jgi:hypothetical protein
MMNNIHLTFSIMATFALFLEAVAVVIQCKSNNIDNVVLREWQESIGKLETSTQSITRIFSGVINGLLEAEKQEITDRDKVTQTATRPIRILCHLNNGEKTYTKPEKGLFDMVICANNVDSDEPKLNVQFENNKNLGEWYANLNHNNALLYKYKKEYINDDTLQKKYEVSNNTILSLIFQLNQLLMLINNPMLFPHQAYAEMFNKVENE